MKKIKIGSVEVLGYIGNFIWVMVMFLRGSNLSFNNVSLLLLGILPNLGAAWAVTMFGKWIVIYILKQDITIKWHLFICIGVFVLAFASEIVHDLFLNSPFDIYDVIITAIAQLVIFFVPVLIKDKYFSNYN